MKDNTKHRATDLPQIMIGKKVISVFTLNVFGNDKTFFELDTGEIVMIPVHRTCVVHVINRDEFMLQSDRLLNEVKNRRDEVNNDMNILVNFINNKE